MDGWVGGWVDLGLKLTQPPIGVGAWAELGNSFHQLSDKSVYCVSNEEQPCRIQFTLLESIHDLW